MSFFDDIRAKAEELLGGNAVEDVTSQVADATSQVTDLADQAQNIEVPGVNNNNEQ